MTTDEADDALAAYRELNDPSGHEDANWARIRERAEAGEEVTVPAASAPQARSGIPLILIPILLGIAVLCALGYLLAR